MPSTFISVAVTANTVPRTLQRREEDYFGKSFPRKDILKYIEQDLKKNVDKERFLCKIKS